MGKEIDIKGQISPHQWGVVENRGGQREPYRQGISSTRRPQFAVLGAIGNTVRQNRDNMRVIDRKGTIYCLKSHIDKEHPLVVRKWTK